MADLREEIESAYTADTGTSTAAASAPAAEPQTAPVATETDAGAKDSNKQSGNTDTPKPAEVEETSGEVAPSKSATPTVEQVAGAEAKPELSEDKKVQSDKEPKPDGGADAVKPPQSWRKQAKEVWNSLPPAAQAEVLRREREMTSKLQEAAQDRQRISAIEQVLEPHRERIARVHGGNPLQAVQRMLHVEQVMFGGSPAQKAQLVARMIKEFNVDIETLDNTLAGQATPEARQANELERLLEQKLAPVQQYMTAMQQREELQRQSKLRESELSVQQMAEDNDLYPHFEAAREDMADLIELYAKKGLAITLPEAYSKVVRMLDLEPARQQGTSTQAALEAHRAAQAAKGASVSVSGAPVSTGKNHGNPKDLRGLIASAFDGGDRI